MSRPFDRPDGKSGNGRQVGNQSIFRKVGKIDRKVRAARWDGRCAGQGRSVVHAESETVTFQHGHEIFSFLARIGKPVDGNPVFDHFEREIGLDPIGSRKSDGPIQGGFKIPDRSLSAGIPPPCDPDPVRTAGDASDFPSGGKRRNPVEGILAGDDKRPDRDDSGRGNDGADDMTGKHRQSGGHFPAVLNDLRQGQKNGHSGNDQDAGLDRGATAFVDRPEFGWFRSLIPE